MSASYPLVRKRYAFSTRLGVSTSPSRLGSSPTSASRRLIKSCICLFYIWSFSLALGPPPPRAEGLGAERRLSASAAPAPSADALYADRGNLANARRAASLWTAQLAADSRDFDTAWKLGGG